MTQPGPSLDALLHRLSECPAEFLDVAGVNAPRGVDVLALACDLVRAFDPDQPPELMTDWLRTMRKRTGDELKLVSILCWLLHDEWFLGQSDLAPRVCQLLAGTWIATLVGLVRPEKFVPDPDRREELVRVCLAQLGLRPAGESASQAKDRLNTLDSAERDRVLRATAAAERRAREVREAMARQRAQESASRYGE